MSGMWYTKQDVMNDLATYTGVRIGDFEDGCIVRGEKPPPPILTEEDNEFEHRFGKGDGHALDSVEPDLAGITQMLRLVDTYDTPKEETNKKKSPSKGSKKAPEESIVISKLNPDVDEFIPSSLQNNTTVEDSKSTNELKDNKMNDNTEKENTAIHNEPPNDEEVEKKKMMEALRNKIAAASNSFEKKRNKNAAIAALLRLHSTPQESPSPKSTSSSVSPQLERIEAPKPTSPKPVLFTPDYFAGPSKAPKSLKQYPSCSPKGLDEGHTSAPNLHDEDTTSSPKVEVIIEEPSNSPKFKEDDRENNILEKSPMPMSPSSSSSKDSLERSIEKVNNWLSPSKKPQVKKSPVLLTEPVTFRKKQSVATKSSSSDVSNWKKTSAYPTYVPSENVKALTETFKNRAREIEKNKPRDIWEQLDYDLKARDEVILKQRREQLENAGNQSPTFSS